MAKARTRTQSFSLAPRAPAPIIRIATPRPASPAKHKGHGRRRRSAAAASGGGSIMEMAIAAGVVGLAEKAGALDMIPSIPVVGKKGAAALALHYFGKGNKWARKASIVLAVVSAYEWGKNGSVSGDDD